MIQVLFNGYRGRMGSALVPGIVSAPDLELVAVCDACSVDPVLKLQTDNGTIEVPAYHQLAEALDQHQVSVMVDFTQPQAISSSLAVALPRGVNCVVGTTGLAAEEYQQIYQQAAEGTCLFVAPNFNLGAVLMMDFARRAAVYFADAEIIEFHHNGKKDAPSGTAINTARQMAEARRLAGLTRQSPGAETELPSFPGARGCLVDDIPVHSVRGGGFVAHQEVILSSAGENLLIRHDSIDRSSYLPGVLQAIRSIGGRSGLIIGLEHLLEL